MPKTKMVAALAIAICLTFGDGGRTMPVPVAAVHPSHALPAPESEDARFIDMHNQARAQHGLPPLAFSQELATPAQRHTQEMAERGEIYHTSDMHGSAPEWGTLSENVGTSWSLDQMFSDFMDSPEHREAILSREFDHIGVGVVYTKDDSVFATVWFGVAPRAHVVAVVASFDTTPVPRPFAKPRVRRRVAPPDPPARRTVMYLERMWKMSS